MNDPERSELVAKASRAFLTYVLIPFWMLPGFGDYLCHRASDIEHTSGTHESLTHVLMIASTGAGIGAGLFFEVNELVLLIMTGSALTHEAIVLWDVGYAVKRRPPSSIEQHMHSFLEVIPFAALAFSVCLHPEKAAALIGCGTKPRELRLEPKREPESPLYIAAVLALGTVALALPYAEEFIRCFRVDHTLLPRK